MVFGRAYEKRFCAFCATPRNVYVKRHLGPIDIAAALILTALVMFAIWQEFDPRAIVIAVVLCGVTEFCIQLRWRLGISCAKCGFDPVLYMKNHEQAANKVRQHYERNMNGPGLLFLPKVRPPSTTQAPSEPEKNLPVKRKGTVLEKQI